jgi:K+-transporting ATPase ATPase C chain
MSVVKEIRKTSSPAIRLALTSMLLCGLLFPVIITGLAQVAFPSQANGSLAHSSSGKDVGSYLIAQNFSLPVFFHPRNSSISASGVDPDITRDDARAQVPAIASATGISQNDLNALIDRNLEGTFWIFGSPYVNVLRLNMALAQNFPSVYCPQYC